MRLRSHIVVVWWDSYADWTRSPALESVVSWRPSVPFSVSRTGRVWSCFRRDLKRWWAIRQSTKTSTQSIKYAAKIVFIWVWFYWWSFEEQQAHGPHLLTWVNSYKSLSMHFNRLDVIFMPNYPFGCHSSQSNSAFWTECIYSAKDYSSNISLKLLSTYLQWVHFFPVRWVISLLLIYIICPGLLLQSCLVIIGLCLGITTPEMTFTFSSGLAPV